MRGMQPTRIEESSAPQQVNWWQVMTFYVLACAFSWPFFWWRDMALDSWNAWNVPGPLKSATYMWGPGLSALICFFVFRRTHQRRITLTGTSLTRSLAFYLVPLVALAAVGGKSIEGMSGHVFPLVMGIAAFLTIFGEELGWRGFLQDVLRPMSPGWRYALIGVLWELWHFTNRTHSGPLSAVLQRLLVSYPLAILLSWLIGEAVERSKSLLVASSLHLWVDLLDEFQTWQADVVLVASMALWIWLLFGWRADLARRPWPLRQRRVDQV
jgi:hypothetical protein